MKQLLRGDIRRKIAATNHRLSRSYGKFSGCYSNHDSDSATITQVGMASLSIAMDH